MFLKSRVVIASAGDRRIADDGYTESQEHWAYYNLGLTIIVRASTFVPSTFVGDSFGRFKASLP